MSDFISECWKQINERNFEDELLEMIFEFENPDIVMKRKKQAELEAAEKAKAEKN